MGHSFLAPSFISFTTRSQMAPARYLSSPSSSFPAVANLSSPSSSFPAVAYSGRSITASRMRGQPLRSHHHFGRIVAISVPYIERMVTYLSLYIARMAKYLGPYIARIAKYPEPYYKYVTLFAKAMAFYWACKEFVQILAKSNNDKPEK